MAAVLNGVVVALALSVGIIALSLTMGGIGDPYQLALTASMALVVVIVLAASIGATIPLLLERLNVDPASQRGRLLRPVTTSWASWYFPVSRPLLFGVDGWDARCCSSWCRQGFGVSRFKCLFIARQAFAETLFRVAQKERGRVPLPSPVKVRHL